MNTAPIRLNNINYCFKHSKTDKKPSQKANVVGCKNSSIANDTVFLSNNKHNAVSFEGNVQNLFSNFVESGTDNIYEFLCKVKKTNSFQVRNFLDNILENNELATKFIQEITQTPRKSADIVINLTKKLGGPNNFRSWYLDKSGYRETFGKYVGEYYDRAKTLEELLMFFPNWKLSDIVAKYHKSVTGDVFQGGDPLIGTLPKELFEKYSDFTSLINEVKKQSQHNRSGEIFLDTNKLKYEILKDADDKMVCKVASVGKNKDFVIKIDKIYSDYIYSRIRANSVYLESMIGKYLTANNCKDVPKFYFYDFFHNAAVFEHVAGSPLEKELNPEQMNRLTPDMLSLGIRTNDTHLSNYLATNSGVKNIDLGNATYFDALKPGDLAHTMSLPNYTGLDFSSMYSMVDFAKFIKNSQKTN